MRLRILLAALSLLAPPAGFAQELRNFPCKYTDKACALKAGEAHSIHKLDTWKEALAKPVGERLGPAPPRLIEYLHLDNVFNGYPERPRAAVLDAAFLVDVKAAIAELPPPVWRIFNDRFLGLYFVEDLGGTGFTDFVVRTKDDPVAGYIVLDASILKRQTANAWATWKENTPFKFQTALALKARIEEDRDDNRKNAIQYILLHELGHVLSIGGNVHPPWNLTPKAVPTAAKYPFFDLSWKIDRKADKYVTLFDAQFPQRKHVVYYFGAKLPATEMVTIYSILDKTNFVSLYAVTKPGDDFAESFASYVHVVLMKRPWSITLSRGPEVLKTFNACWEEQRCAAKRKILDELLKEKGDAHLYFNPIILRAQSCGAGIFHGRMLFARGS